MCIITGVCVVYSIARAYDCLGVGVGVGVDVGVGVVYARCIGVVRVCKWAFLLTRTHTYLFLSPIQEYG